LLAELSLQNKHFCRNDDDMTLRVGIRIAVVIAVVAIYFSWRAEVRSHADLAAELLQPNRRSLRLNYLRRTCQTQTEIDSIQQNLTVTRITRIDIKNPA